MKWFYKIWPGKWDKLELLGIPFILYSAYLDPMAAFWGFCGCRWLMICREENTREKHDVHTHFLRTKIMETQDKCP